MTIIKAAAVQISPVLYSREDTTAKIVQKIVELGREGVQFATFPETILPYYPYFSFVQRPFEAIGQNLVLFEQSVTVPSPTTVAIGEACRQANIVVSIGINERDGGTLYNTQLLFRCGWHPHSVPAQDIADPSRTYDLGPRRRFGAQGRRQRGGARGAAGMLGALQSIGAICADG